MKVKDKINYKDLKFNIAYENFNCRELMTVNVFDYVFIKEELDKIAKRKPEKRPDFNTFNKEINSLMIYHFWGRCEYEFIISSWPSGRWETKVDVYEQIKLNWDLFIRQCWDYTTQHWRKK